jgi:hypothetical protein
MDGTMEASIADMARKLAPSDLGRVLAEAALEVEIEVFDALDGPWLADDGVVIITDDAHQLDRSARLPRVQVMYVVGG